MKRNHISALLFLYFLVSVSIVSAQEKPAPSWQSFQQAKQVLDAGINVLGGLENIRRADKITINYKTIGHPVGQNAAFTAPLPNIERVGAKTLIDFSGVRYVTEGQSNFPGGYKFNFRQVVAPKKSFSIDLLQNRRGNTILDSNENAKSTTKINLLTEVPHLLLLYVSQRPETLRYSGESEIDGIKLQVISFAAENGATITLYFDAQTKLLVRTEQISQTPQLGDIVSGNIYADYRKIGNVLVPRRRNTFINQFITNENEYAEVKLDFTDGEKLLEVPAGFVESPAPANNAQTEAAKKMGDGVYLIERFGYRVMFVEFEDHVMVLETPLNNAISRGVIQTIKQTAPGKPIRYVAFSHFHFDHTGGLREYIAEGATVIVPPGNKTFVEQFAKSKLTVQPDALALKPREPVIETFEKKRVFSDGKRTIELHSIGPVSHVNDMVMFYFPKEKILFQGDMFSQLDQGGIPPIIEINHELVKKVNELKLDVETLIGVHSGAVAWKDFLAAVDKDAR